MQPEHLMGSRLLAGIRKLSKLSVHDAPEPDDEDDAVRGTTYAMKFPVLSSTAAANDSNCSGRQLSLGELLSHPVHFF